MKWVIFVNNMVCPLLLLPGKKRKNMIKFTKTIIMTNIKNTKIIWSNLMIFMLKRKMFPKNMINNIYIYIYICVCIL